MKITETRKAIIELIEPFMEKYIIKWCMLLMTDGRIEFVEWIFDYDWPWDYIDDYFIGKEYVTDIKMHNVIDKIIWHYDITAVLKYFEEYSYSWWKLWPNSINIEKDYIEIQEIKKLCKCDIPEISTIIWKFPNKPLHLYTEEEEKNLLELLQKLWKK